MSQINRPTRPLVTQPTQPYYNDMDTKLNYSSVFQLSWGKMLDLMDNTNIPGTSHQTPQINFWRQQTPVVNRGRPQLQRTHQGCGTGDHYDQIGR